MTNGARAGREWKSTVLRDFPIGARYLIGVSGGRDSVTLLHWLLTKGYSRLVVCHLDHGLRGRASVADGRFVARLAQAKKLSCELGRTDVRAQAAEKKLSIETAARSARYDFFAQVARRRRCPIIFLGHHADDLVETFLINLFRGTGTRGQRSIQAVSTRSLEKLDLTIVRPLLGVWRTEIDAYIETHRLRFRDDSSNEELSALRNRMRHRIIPALEKEFGRDIRKAINRAATIAAEEDAILEALIPPDLAGTEMLSVPRLRSLPIALQRRVITRWLDARAVSGIGFEMVEEIRALLDVAAGRAKMNLTGGRHVRRRAGKLFIE